MPSYVVTGAARGIGFEFVRQLSNGPDNAVFAVVRNKKTATKLEELKRPNVYIFEANICNHKALKDAAQEVSKITDGKLDVLINNAAVARPEGATSTLDGFSEKSLLEEDLKETFNINVIGVVHTINAFLPLLRAGSTKKVLTLSSVAADAEFNEKAEMPFMAAYSISKAAVNMVVTKYAIQYKSEGFVFLAISPGGAVDTAEGDVKAAEKFEMYKTLITTMFQKVKPSFEGPITPYESVKAQLEVMEKSTVKDTGAFVSHHGNKDWL